MWPSRSELLSETTRNMTCWVFTRHEGENNPTRLCYRSVPFADAPLSTPWRFFLKMQLHWRLCSLWCGSSSGAACSINAALGKRWSSSNVVQVDDVEQLDSRWWKQRRKMITARERQQWQQSWTEIRAQRGVRFKNIKYMSRLQGAYCEYFR